MAKVVLGNIEKIFSNGNVAIDGLNLCINDGEFMVIVGPSGCSKSTVLRTIAGLETINSGEIFIGDREVKNIAPKDRSIAMVFQNYALYPHMTVYDNLAFSLKMLKKPKEKINKKVKSILKIMELTNYLHSMPREMSGGQKQRVAIGRTLVREPEVFLFDEPLSNLDAKLRVQLRLEIIKFHKELKNRKSPSTIVYVTHDQTEAMTMGDRICVMNFGKIMQVDTPINLYNFPANKFVASFIGTPQMNIGKGRIIFENNDFYIQVYGNLLLLPKDKKEKLKGFTDEKIWFGIRPEDVVYTEEVNMINTIKGTISLLEKTGNETLIYFRVQESLLVSRFYGEISEKLQIGLEAYFHFKMDKCHVFEFFTEKNLFL